MNSQDIQVEGGNWTRIHNAILEQLAATPLSGTEFRCLMFLFRQTYGFGKKEDKISLAQWEAGTGMKRQNAWNVLNDLKAKQIIYSIDNGPRRPQTWGFNKHFEQWCLTDAQSVMPQHDSFDQSVMPQHDRSVMPQHDSFDQSVMPQHDRSVMPQHYYKRNKEIAAARAREPNQNAAAAANSTGPPDLYGQYRGEYERLWGLLISSPYEKEKVEDWMGRVTLETWRYGLRESADHRKVGNWKYLERILRRVEQEGLPGPEEPIPKAPPLSGNVNLGLTAI